MTPDASPTRPDSSPPSANGEDPTLPPYRPIACATHDRLEAMAVKGREGVFLWTSPSGGTASAVARIRDIQVRDGAEFLILANGTEIRLDLLRKVDGVEVASEES